VRAIQMVVKPPSRRIVPVSMATRMESFPSTFTHRSEPGGAASTRSGTRAFGVVHESAARTASG
jgi:hypothetical protein